MRCKRKNYHDLHEINIIRFKTADLKHDIVASIKKYIKYSTNINSNINNQFFLIADNNLLVLIVSYISKPTMYKVGKIDEDVLTLTSKEWMNIESVFSDSNVDTDIKKDLIWMTNEL
jgi:hypothetical protein